MIFSRIRFFLSTILLSSASGFAYSAASNGVVAGGDQPPIGIAGDVNNGITVNINAAPGGTSHNTYTHFNVPTSGVTLNNGERGGDGAHLIINEVTSSNISTLEGALTVSGDKAHVVVANPNGITVDGGSFVNSAAVMLTTGDIHRFDDYVGDELQTLKSDGEYFVAHVDDGAIQIKGGGIGGSFSRLDLLAKTISVEGALNVENVVALVGGDSTVVLENVTSAIDPDSYEFEEIFQELYSGSCSGASDISAGASWNCETTTPGFAAGDNDYVIDITGASASIESGTINITVNDVGAGFRFAGKSLVSESSDITISSNGGIEIEATDGGSITAVRDITMESVNADIVFNGSATDQATITAGRDLSIEISNDSDADNVIVNSGYALQSILPETAAALLNGSVVIRATTFINRSLSEDGLGIVFSSSNKVGSGGYDWDGGDVGTGGVTIETSGDLYNESARIISNNGITFNVGGDIYNRVVRASGSNQGLVKSTSKSSGWFLFKKKKTDQSYDYGELAINGLGSYITASSGDILMNFTGNGRLYNVGGEISANGAQNYVPIQVVLENAALDTNSGALANNSLTLTSGGSSKTFVFEGASEAGVDDGLEMLLSFVEYIQEQRAADPSLFPDITSIEVVKTSYTDDGAYGIVIGSELARSYALSGNVSGSDETFYRLSNASGSYSDGSIFIGGQNTDLGKANAVGALVNQTVVSGRSWKKSSCGWFCNQSGESNVTITGGLISAQNKLNVRLQRMIDAGDGFADDVDYSDRANLSGDFLSATSAYDQGYFINVGGRVTALNNVQNNYENAINIYGANGTNGTIRVLAKALPTHNVTKRNQGYLSRDFVKVLRQDQGGTFLASLGQINLSNLHGTGFDGEGVRILGGSLFAERGLTLGDESDTDARDSIRDQDDLDPNRTEPISDSPVSNDNIGATGKLLDYLF